MKRLLVRALFAGLAFWAFVHLGNDVLRRFESPRPSRSIGTPAKGRLEHGKRIPTSGSNFTTYSRLGALLGRTAVHHQVRDAVLEAYRAAGHTHPDAVFVLGETGWPSGGHFRPHRTHRNGLSVDFMVPVRRNGRPVRLPCHPLNRFGYGVHFHGEGRAGDLAIDYEAMAAHLLALREAAAQNGLAIEVVIFDNELQRQLFAAPGGGGLRQALRFSRRPAWVRHDEHYHVDFRLR